VYLKIPLINQKVQIKSDYYLKYGIRALKR
jgi:hypothetical protein